MILSYVVQFNHLEYYYSALNHILLLGNIHINLPGMKEDMVSTVKERLEPFVYEWVVKHGGSISAEHGIGLVSAQHTFIPPAIYGNKGFTCNYAEQEAISFDPETAPCN